MSYSIDLSIENVLRSVILPDLEKGRKDFDRPHTEAVVYWMKTLLQKINNSALDPLVLITAAYAHDWGYIGLFDGVNSSDPEEIKKRKPLHMERGAQLISTLIQEKLSFAYTPTQREDVAHLVLMHDKVEELVTELELLIMEADTLGMLDASRVHPTFSKEDNGMFMESEINKRRVPRFIHRPAQETAAKLVKLRMAFYD